MTAEEEVVDAADEPDAEAAEAEPVLELLPSEVVVSDEDEEDVVVLEADEVLVTVD